MSKVAFLVLAFVFVPYSATAQKDSEIVKPTTDFTKPELYERFPGGSSTHQKLANEDAFSFPSANMSFTRQLDFSVGNRLFTRNWVSIESGSRGIGPLFNARSCQSCHLRDGRGHLPTSSQDDAISLIVKLGNADFENGDPVYGEQFQDFAVANVKSEGKVEISYSVSKVKLADGSIIELRKPKFNLVDLKYGDLDSNTYLKPRITPPMIGLGLLQAVSADDVRSNADPSDANKDGISGRVNSGSYGGGEVIGRFGWKAEVDSIRRQTQLALFHDMGLSTEDHYGNSGGCTDRQKKCMEIGGSQLTSGVEVNSGLLDAITFYASNLAVPKRRDVASAEVLAGKEIFYDIGCVSCHRPKYITQHSDSHPEQSRQLIWPYTDLLLHDMGQGLADPDPSKSTNAREWRTPPLWGIGLTSLVNQEYGFLHDGRAKTIVEAILWHGGEAQQSKEKVIELNREQRTQLIRFINSL